MRQLAAALVKLFTATAVGQLIGFAVLAVVSRRLGPARLGSYGFAVNFIGWFALPVVGIGMVAVRDVARDRDRVATIAGKVVPVLAVYTAIACTTVWVLAPAISPTAQAASMLRIVSFQIAAGLLSVEWALQGLGAFGTLSLARVAGQVGYAALAVALVSADDSGLDWYAALNMVGLAVTIVIVWCAFLRRVGRPIFRFSARGALRTWRESLPFTVSLVMIAVYFNGDFVLLGFLAPSRSVGQYVVAYKIPAALLGLASVWVGVFYPHAAAESSENLRSQVGAATTVTICVLLPLLVGSTILGEPLIAALFGPKYGPAGTYFKILMLAVVLGGIDACIGQVLLGRDEDRYFALAAGAGAGANLLLNIMLIPQMGPSGSAIATVVAEFLILMLMTAKLRRLLGTPPIQWSRVAAALTSSGLMALALMLVSDGTQVFVRMGIGLVVLALAAVLTGALRRSDLQRLRRPPSLQPEPTAST